MRKVEKQVERLVKKKRNKEAETELLERERSTVCTIGKKDPRDRRPGQCVIFTLLSRAAKVALIGLKIQLCFLYLF
jgi:hypothetical protein